MKGYYAIDAGALYEMAANSDNGVTLREAIKRGDVVASTHELALTEVLYLICRRIGFEKAKHRVDILILSGLIALEPTAELMETAARIKCARPIALADCYTLALAENRHLVALFAEKEAELVREMERAPFDVEMEFLSERGSSTN